jgi:hypothetical protein
MADDDESMANGFVVLAPKKRPAEAPPQRPPRRSFRLTCQALYRARVARRVGLDLAADPLTRSPTEDVIDRMRP